MKFQSFVFNPFIYVDDCWTSGVSSGVR